MSITLPIRRDSTYEANEDYEIRLSNASSGSAVDADFALALTTVFNDDAGIQFSQTTLANSATIAEGDQDKGAAFVDLIGDDTQYTTISYTVERVGNTLVQSTVTWALTYLDGANEADFVLPISRELSFGTSDTDPQTIDIKVRKDLLAEGNEAFTLTLSTESVGSSAEVNHVVTTTIIDNDEGLRLLGGQSARKHVNEGQTANTELSWTLERTGDLSAALDVSYIVTGKSVYEVLPDIYGWLPEASGNDFVGGTYPSGTIHFDAGASTALVKVAVQADLDIETSEAFQIVLTPQRKIDQLSVHEEGYATALGYLNNDTQQSLEGVILRDEAIVAITEELTSDTDFSTRGLNSAQAEGDSDVSYVSHFFKVFRSLTQSGEVTVDWNVESSGGETKVDSPLFVHDQVVGASSADFVLKPGQLANGNGLPSGTAVISDGQEYVLVEIRTAGNDVAADSKKFKVVLSNVSEGSTINQNNDAHIGEGFIENDDPLFSLGLITPSGDSAITSGSRVWTESDGEITYRIYRTGDTAGAALVDYAITFPIVASRPNSAALNTDFAASAADFDTVSAPLSGTVSFADGQEFVNLTFKLANETLAENFAETFNLSLSDPRWDIGETSTKTLGISSVAGSMTQVILDDDIGSRVAVTAVSSESGGGLTFYEGTGVSAKTVTYTLTRTGDDLSMGQIAWQIVGRNTVNVTGDTLSSITQGFGDGTLVRRGLVSFAQGETVKTITLTLANDNEVAADAQINFELFDARQILRNGISLQNNWGQDINGDIGIYLGNSGTANDTGLLPESGSIIRDETANAIAVNLRNDDTRVIVNSVINYSPAISVWEPDSGTRAITLNLTREGNLEHDLTLAYDIVTNGTADSDDVVVKTGTFTLAAGTDLASNGSKSYSFDLDILKGDVAREADENFTIRLSNIETNAIETAYFYQNWSKTDSIDVAVTVKTNDVTWTALAEVTELVELNSTFSVYSFTISRPEGNGNYSGPAIIAWQVAGMGDHPATVSDFYGYDNVMPAGNVTFVTGEYTKTITIKVAGDNQVEHNETFTIGLVSADVGQIDATTTTMKIRNNDTGISISDVGVLEGDAGTATMTFTVTRSGNLTQDAFAKWATTLDGTAAPTDLADLLSGAGDLIFDAVVTDYAQQGDAADYGEQTQQVTVTVKGDTLGEADETLSVRLSSLQNVNESIDLLGRGIIFNDDTRFSIEAGPSVYEGDPVGQMFIIRRDRLTYQDQTLNWSISTESGSHGADAADLSGGAGSSTLLTNSVTFHAGELEKIVYVKTVADDVAETNQSFIFTASAGEGVSSAQIPDGVVYGVILNDDEGEVVVTPDSYLVASDATAVVEGDSGTVYAEFTVTRSGALGFDGSVNWAVGVTTNSANNANAADFVGGLATGTLAMALGQTSFTIRVPISGDSVMEGDETFKLVLSNPSPGLQVTTGTAFGTISNDDARFDIESAVTAYANAAPITEGTGDSPSQISFTILRTGNTARAMSVNWDVAYRDQDNFGTGDFAGTGFPSGVVNFAAGEESQVVTLDIRTDDRYELDETFRIKLTDSSTGSSIGAANSFFKIMNDDVDVFSLRASTFTQTEGDVAEGFTNFTFTATRLSDDTSATVAWTAVGSGEQPLDVQQLMAGSGTVSFAIGELSKDFTVSVANNLVGDYDRGFDVQLSEPLIYIPNSTPETTDDPVDAVNGGVIDPDQSYVSATLANDDPVYAVSFTGDGITVEGNGTKGGFVRFLITRAGDSSGETSLNWALSDDGDVKANLSDFGGFWPSGTVLFKDGETEKLVQARISGDTKYEGDETFKVTISEINSSVEGAVILVNTDQGIIKNDDNGVFISAEVSEVYEGENNNPVAFNIGVTGLAYQTVTVQYVIEGYGLNPINAQDIDESSYGAGERTLHTDADGFATDSITVYVMGDTNFGATEGMRLRVTSIVNGSLATNTGMIDIINDDNLVSIARAQNHAPTVSEGNADTVTLTYIVTRKGDTTRAAYFAYEVIGTGDNPAGHWDIAGGFGTFPGYFEPGQTTAEITVQINGDTTFESDESFVIRLVPYNQWPQNNESIADIDASASQITETILNDDSASIRAEALTDSVKEGTLGANTLSYRM
jgi:hypothetical protein